MASQVQIANLALSEMGASRIISFDDGTNAANLISAIYDDLADQVMAAHPWTSTIRRAELNQLVEKPIFGFAFQYQLPTDPYCLRALDINEAEVGVVPYKIEGRLLLTDVSSIKIRYISRITDPQAYDVKLQEAIVARLIAETAYNLTGSRPKQQQAWELYRLKIQDGQATDGLQGSTDVLVTNDLINVR